MVVYKPSSSQTCLMAAEVVAVGVVQAGAAVDLAVVVGLAVEEGLVDLAAVVDSVVVAVAEAGNPGRAHR